MAKKLTFIEDDALWYRLKQEEEYYYAHEYPRVQKDLREFVEELHEEKRTYLLERLKELKKNPNDSRIPSLMKEIKLFTGKLKGITPELIQRARESPISSLVEVKRNMALCPFHPDKHPSMDVRKNFYHCYSCGANGDVIDLAMKIKNLTFTQAVTFLT